MSPDLILRNMCWDLSRKVVGEPLSNQSVLFWSQVQRSQKQSTRPLFHPNLSSVSTQPVLSSGQFSWLWITKMKSNEWVRNEKSWKEMGGGTWKLLVELNSGKGRNPREETNKLPTFPTTNDTPPACSTWTVGTTYLFPFFYVLSWKNVFYLLSLSLYLSLSLTN